MIAAPAVIVREPSKAAQQFHHDLKLAAPVDLQAVAKTCRLPITPLPPGGPGPVVDAFLAFRPARNLWAVFYNPLAGDRRRRRFSIAHELGHFVLHRKLIESGRSMDHRWYEQQANEFASELLMPGSEISYARMFYNRPETYFDVSAAAWQRRLSQLRRLGY